jgi:hypothetical protein
MDKGYNGHVLCGNLLSPPNLRLEAALDCTHTASTPAALARHEVNPVLLRQDRIKGFARLARNIFHYN